MKTIIIDGIEYNLTPKVAFRKGDWVVNKSGDVWHIDSFDKKNYQVSNADGEYCYFPISKQDEMHLWSIQDAKDGDVLYYKDEISLYKHDIKNCTKQETTFGGFVYHCCYDGEGFITDSLYSLTEQDKMDIHPATKEQRDKLEKAITKAGYKWDVEKMELKTIEQEQAIDCLADVSRDNWEFVHEFVEKFGRIPKDEDELNALVEYVLKRQKPNTWSEEDEHRITDTIYFLDTAKKHYACTEELDNCIERLKSLKERYTWKPSDEQINTLEQWLKDNRYCGDARYCYPIFDSLYQGLKKLKG